MGSPYPEFELTYSAYRHGYGDEDFAQMLRGRILVTRSRRGRLIGYEVFGRNAAGAYLHAVGRVVQSGGRKVLRVFHLSRMKDADRKRYRRWLAP
jgi:hypothetical protein